MLLVRNIVLLNIEIQISIAYINSIMHMDILHIHKRMRPVPQKLMCSIYCIDIDLSHTILA